MSTAGVKIATTIAVATANHVADVADGVVVNEKYDIKTANTKSNNDNDEANEKNISSFCNLPAVSEHQSSISSVSSTNELQLEQLNKVPLENSSNSENNEADDNLQTNQASGREFPQDGNHKQPEDDVDNTTAALGHHQISPGLSLLQQTAAASSSPPPHSYRHSRAYRHFKNPPQPHMCIRTTTEAGEELFINVLSWTRIVIPQEPSDPIPLYGGMRVPPGSPRSPPIVFAVMANPEVLKDSGRHSKDPEERRAMVELMCDFVEAMNPGVKLIRNAIILKDRDISGELKDVWNAVQAQRDREREEQMMLQRQQHQQHFHNITNASTNGIPSANNSSIGGEVVTATTQQMFPKIDSVVATDVEGSGGTPPRSRKIIQEVQNDNTSNMGDHILEMDKAIRSKTHNGGQMSLALLAEHLDNKMSLTGAEQMEECDSSLQAKNQNTLTNDALSNGNNSKNSSNQEVNNKMDLNNQLNAINCNKELKTQSPALPLTNGMANNCNDSDVSNASKNIIVTSTINNTPTHPAQNPTTTNTVITPPSAQQTPPTKKEKLGGFLPNGCIFPRFTKNNKHKDKDKEKETKSKDKEKNVLLSALKKSKDKKSNANAAATSTAAINQEDKNTSLITNSTTAAVVTNCNQTNNKQQQKNCLQQLETGVQKIDLNNHHLHHSQTTAADNNINNMTTTNNSTTSSVTGVGVH